MPHVRRALFSADLTTTALIPRYWGFVLLGSIALNLLLLSLPFGSRKSIFSLGNRSPL